MATTLSTGWTTVLIQWFYTVWYLAVHGAGGVVEAPKQQGFLDDDSINPPMATSFT